MLFSLRKANVQAGASVELVIDAESPLRTQTLLVVERRLQVNGAYPKNPDWSWRLLLGDARQFVFVLDAPVPATEGTYQYTVSIVDDLTGTVALTDSRILQAVGQGQVAAQAEGVDFTFGEALVNGKPVAMRVVYSTSTLANLVLEWNQYRYGADGNVEQQPFRTTRWTMDQFFVGDLQLVLPVQDPEGKYQWQFRLIDNSLGKVLSHKEKDVVILAAPRVIEAQPPDVSPSAPAPVEQIARLSPVGDATPILAGAALVLGALGVGYAVCKGAAPR